MHCHLYSVLFILAAGALSGLTTPIAPDWYTIHVKHAWSSVPKDWESLGPPPVGTTINLRIGLKPHNKHSLIDVLYEVSTPRHPKYGSHLSKGQVAELVAPHPNTLDLLNSWLEHHGISSSISTTQGSNRLTLIGVPVPKANAILGASFQLYQHAVTNDTVLRTVSYALPAVLHAHVQTVAPTTFFGAPRSTTQMQIPQMRRSHAPMPLTKASSVDPATVLSRDYEYLHPSYLHWLYHTEGYKPGAEYGKNVLATVSYEEDTPSPEDLEKFMRNFRSDGLDATFTVMEVNVFDDDSRGPSIEANLNIQYAIAMTYPTRNVYYTLGEEFGDPQLAWLDLMLDKENKDIPQTIVTTYGVYEHLVPPEYADDMCRGFAELGARGVSILFASGNNGVGGGDCMVQDSSGNLHYQFTPIFPADCPWVTVVGGTTGNDPEVAASLSGGGFSNLFDRPDYQDDAVLAFLEDHVDKEYDGLYNPEGRGYPDIAAQALDFATVYNGEVIFRQGTSCSTPTVGGIVALLNDFRIRNGKRALGFLNPILYDEGFKDTDLEGAGINDITSGSNRGCGKTFAFYAVEGWDPVTGLGTPDFYGLSEKVDAIVDSDSDSGSESGSESGSNSGSDSS